MQIKPQDKRSFLKFQKQTLVKSIPANNQIASVLASLTNSNAWLKMTFLKAYVYGNENPVVGRVFLIFNDKIDEL